MICKRDNLDSNKDYWWWQKCKWNVCCSNKAKTFTFYMPHIIWFRNLDTAFDRIKMKQFCALLISKISFSDEIQFLLVYGLLWKSHQNGRSFQSNLKKTVYSIWVDGSGCTISEYEQIEQSCIKLKVQKTHGLRKYTSLIKKWMVCFHHSISDHDYDS